MPSKLRVALVCPLGLSTGLPYTLRFLKRVVADRIDYFISGAGGAWPESPLEQLIHLYKWLRGADKTWAKGSALLVCRERGGLPYRLSRYKQFMRRYRPQKPLKKKVAFAENPFGANFKYSTSLTAEMQKQAQASQPKPIIPVSVDEVPFEEALS